MGVKALDLGVYILHIFPVKWKTLYTFSLRQANTDQVLPASSSQRRFPPVQHGSFLHQECSLRISVPMTLVYMFAELQPKIFIFHFQVSKIQVIIVDRQLNNYLTNFWCICAASLQKLNVQLNQRENMVLVQAVFILTASVYIFSVYFIY